MRLFQKLSQLGFPPPRRQTLSDTLSRTTSMPSSGDLYPPSDASDDAQSVGSPKDATPPCLMMFPPYDESLQTYVVADDPVRFASVLIALRVIDKDGIPGSCAELGVYRGDMSIVIHTACPHRLLYLFDTFEGFPARDLPGDDGRFRDTSVEIVTERLGDLTNVIVRKGYFPETAKGLEDEKFAFVMLDADLFAPTMAGLEFFYPRLVPGGYIFAHDYNSPESNWAVSRAVDSFFADKPEKPIAIPDKWGSVIIRKVCV